MTDVALTWNNDLSAADIGLALGAIETEAGLKTALLISLFSDRRALADDELPEAGADPRGWWGDSLLAEGDRIGSRLWLLARGKLTRTTLARAREYAREATAWLIEDRVASSIEIEAEVVGTSHLGLKVVVVRPVGPAREQFDFLWSAL